MNRDHSEVRSPFVAKTGREHLTDMEDEATRELAALQRERELLLVRERENTDAIDEVIHAQMSLARACAARAPLSRGAADLSR